MQSEQGKFIFTGQSWYPVHRCIVVDSSCWSKRGGVEASFRNDLIEHMTKSWNFGVVFGYGKKLYFSGLERFPIGQILRRLLLFVSNVIYYHFINNNGMIVPGTVC